MFMIKIKFMSGKKRSSYAELIKKNCSLLLTVLLVLMLIWSGPASAVTVTVTPSSSVVDLGKTNELELNINIELQNVDRYVPLSYVILNVTGPVNRVYEFYINGSVKMGGGEIRVEPVEINASYGYGYGYAAGGYEFGYGYGYGYNTSYSNRLSYRVVIKLDNYQVGEYSVNVGVVAAGENGEVSVAKNSATFSLIKTVYVGGGGGEAVKVPSTPTEIVVHTPTGAEFTVSNVQPDVPVKVEFDGGRNITVDEMEIVVNKSMEIKGEVKEVESLPTYIPAPPKPVYSYLRIEVSAEPGSIKYAKIKFKVSKAWMEENDIDESTVKLLRYTGTLWQELSTSMVGEDANYVYYEAETPGFSYFAVVGEKKTVGEEVSPAPSEGGAVNKTKEVKQPETGKVTKPGEENVKVKTRAGRKTLILIIAAVIAAVCIAIYFKLTRE